MKKYFLTVVYAIDDKPETVEAILAQRPWQAVAHTDALADLEHAQANLQAATDGYDAARLEIESLQARIQELGQMARECSDRKVVQLESALARHVRSGKDWGMRVEALERTITTLRAHIASSNAQAAAAKKAMRELEAQVAAVGAGGVEPLRKRECLHSISEPEAQPVGVAPEWWRKRADEIETDVARGGSIAAMNCYTKMRQLLQAATSPQPAVQSLDAREFPAMTPELAAILGTMCFETINLAKILRSAGQDIKTRAEDEQAAVLHWMLSLWFKHGEGWRQAAAQEVMRIKDAAIAAQQGGA